MGALAGGRAGGRVPPDLQEPGEVAGEGRQVLVLGVEAVEHLHLPLAVPAGLRYPLARVGVQDTCRAALEHLIPPTLHSSYLLGLNDIGFCAERGGWSASGSVSPGDEPSPTDFRAPGQPLLSQESINLVR